MNEMKDILKHDSTFRYRLLGRLKSDCDYYLGYGNKNLRYLWAASEKEQIVAMETLWNSFIDEDKPEWITWEQIKKYEKEMLKAGK